MCPLLSSLQLDVDPLQDIQPSVIDIASIIKPHTIPMHLHFTKSIMHDLQLISYMLHKFPHIQNLQISGQPKRISRLNEFTLSKLLTYLANMNLKKTKTENLIHIDSIPFIAQPVTDSIGTLWRNLSQFRTLCVGIKYDSRSPSMDELKIDSMYGPGFFLFQHASSGTGLKHTGIIQEHGRYIDNLKLYGIGMYASQQLDRGLYEILIIDPLKYCTTQPERLLIYWD